MTKLQQDKENKSTPSTNLNDSASKDKSSKIHRTLTLSTLNRKTKQLRKNFLTINNTKSIKKPIETFDKPTSSNRRLSLNPATILRSATKTIEHSSSSSRRKSLGSALVINNNNKSNRRKSITNAFSIGLDRDACKIKEFKSKIDYLKNENLNNYNHTLKKLQNEKQIKTTQVSKTK